MRTPHSLTIKSKILHWIGLLFLALLLFFQILMVGTLAWPMGRSMPDDLTEMSIEDLMAIEVTTVSRKSQHLSQTTAAVFVITQEDIRRSGVTNIAQALRMVPGLQVARIDANKWAISSRGFNGQFANKLLVLMDGRSVYTPLYSGVLWDVQDTLLEDIVRIEVIRGPGAALWGANAVNGVINVITKTAIETQGGLASFGLGTEEKYFGGIRYGGTIGESAFYRAYAKYFKRDGALNAVGDDVPDQWHISRGGGRIDWDIAHKEQLTLQGDYYDGKAGYRLFSKTPFPPYTWDLDEDALISGGNILGRWQHSFSGKSDFTLQAYYDITKRKSQLIAETRDTFDLDFQHRFGLSERQELIWGLGYRLTRADIKNQPIVSYTHPDREDELFSFFVQDEISLWPEKFSLIVGSKFEENDYTGSEIQPNLRMRWTPSPLHTIWASISHAVRTPAQADREIKFYQPDVSGFYSVWVLLGNEEYTSEKLTAYELGWRLNRGNEYGLDLSLFYNRYDDLFSFMWGSPVMDGSPPELVTPVIHVNDMKGYTYGAELVAEWQPTDWWRIQGYYTYLFMNFRDAVTFDLMSLAVEGKSPNHQFSLRSSIDLFKEVKLDLWFRYVDNLSSPCQDMHSIFTLDARLGWNPSENLEISIVGQNLFDPQHPEFFPEFAGIVPSEVQRGMYAKLTWHF